MATEIASMYVSIGASLNPFNRAMGTLNQKVKGAAGAISGGLGGALAVLGGNLMTAAVQGVAQLGQGLLGLGKQSVDLAADFQEQMAILSIAAKSSGLAFDELKSAAIAVGGDVSLLGVSASGAADAMSGLYKAGLTSTEIFGDLQGYMAGTAQLGGALRAAIDLAAASELDMVQASDLAAIALATFGGELETEEERAAFITKAMNNMVQAADASVAEVSDLAAAMKNIGPVAAGFGMSLEETNNALAILSTRGISGAEAGTNLKSMLQRMISPVNAVQEAWQELGLSVYDSEGAMRPLQDILADLEKAFEGMTDKQKDQYMQTLAGNYGIKAMRTLLAGGAESWDAMALATANAAGIQEQAGARAATFKGQMEALEGTLETLWIGIGDAFLPMLTELTTWFSAMVSEHGPAITAFFSTLGEQFGALVNYILAVVQDGDVLNDWLTHLPEGIQPIVKSIGNIITAFQSLIQGVRSGDFSFAELISPDVMMALFSFQDVLNRIGQWWAEFGPAITQKAKEMFGSIIESAQNLAANVLPWISDKLAQFGAWFTENGPLIAAFAGVVMDAFAVVVDEITKAWAWIQPLLDTLIVIILGIGKAIMQMATGDWAGAWQTIQETAGEAWELIKKAWVAFADWVSAWFGTTWKAVLEQWETNWELFKTIVSTVWDNIKIAVITKFLELWLAVHQVINDALSGWETAWKGVKTIVTTIWQNIKTAITNKLTEIWTTITTKITGIKNAILGFVASFVSAGGSLIEGLKQGIINKASDIAGAAREVVQNAINAAREALGIWSPSQVFMGFGENIGEGLTQGLLGTVPKVSEAMRKMIDAPVKRVRRDFQAGKYIPPNLWSLLPGETGIGTAGMLHTPALEPTSPMGGRMRGGGGKVVINININDKLVVRDPADIDMIADAIARRLRLRGGVTLGAYSLG